MNEASREGNPAFHRRSHGTPQWKAHIVCVPITLPQHRSDRQGSLRERSRRSRQQREGPSAERERSQRRPTRSSLQREIKPASAPPRTGRKASPSSPTDLGTLRHGAASSALRAEGTPSLNPNVSCSSQKQGAAPAGHGNRRGERVALRPRSLDAQTRAPESRSAARLLRTRRSANTVTSPFSLSRRAVALRSG